MTSEHSFLISQFLPVQNCNYEVWKSLYPLPNYKHPFINDHYYMDHALFFYHPWYHDPEGIKRLSSTSLTLDADLFFTKYLEDHVNYTYERVDDNIVGLPYYKSMPNMERMRRSLYWITTNDVHMSDQGYADHLVPLNEIAVKERVNKTKPKFKRKKGDLTELNIVAPFSKVKA